MSHEIRTPMNAILGFTEVLRRGGQGQRSLAEQRKHLDIIHASGNHLLQLINDILDLSKVESGRFEIERLQFSPHEVIQEVLQILMVKAQEKGLALRADYPGPLPATIQTDPGRLRQILTNLVGNAIKFTEQGQVSLRMRQESGHIHLAADHPDWKDRQPFKAVLEDDRAALLERVRVTTDLSELGDHVDLVTGLELPQHFSQARGES